MRKSIVTTGTFIVCPACGDKIATVKRDLFLYDRFESADFEGIQRPIRNGDRAICLQCETSWFMGGRLSTERGWVP